jgi:hypothetical protein
VLSLSRTLVRVIDGQLSEPLDMGLGSGRGRGRGRGIENSYRDHSENTDVILPILKCCYPHCSYVICNLSSVQWKQTIKLTTIGIAQSIQ